jgi:flagella basal body P-ring formation protein FlgA
MIRILLVTLNFACCVAANAAGIHLSFPERVQLHKTTVLLGDVVEIEGNDLPVILRLRQIPLGQAPRVGAPVQLTRADVTRWIHSRMGSRADPLLWEGPQSTEISAQAGTADLQQISLIAEQTLKTWLAGSSALTENQPSPRIVVTQQMLAHDVVLPVGDYTYTARPIAAGAVPQRIMDVWVEVHGGGQFLQVVPVRFLIAVFRQAWVTKEKVNSGSRLAMDLCELKEVDVMSVPKLADVRPASYLALAGAQGVRAKRSLSAGEILTYANTENSPTIARGEMVTLRSAVGAVLLEGRGQALEDGVVGQLVHFISNGANNRIVARISGPGVAEIE